MPSIVSSLIKSIATGCIESLKQLLGDDDNTVRDLATDALCTAAMHNIGRNAFLDYGVVIPLSIVGYDL